MGAARTISVEELHAETVELLPSRDAMALVNVTNVTVVGIAISVNAASINATASAAVNQAIATYQY